MYLRALTLQGFKSFGEKTTVEFHKGITAIVGPNGSGKSNIFDSLRWATGGGRASEFRAGEKTDLIFHGAAGKRSVGFAEVRIDIDKPDERLNIARSIFRDGSSKLKLGGKNARFLDLDESLAGTGLGRGGLAVIGQGKVSDVLMADSQKLLGYVQEAIGVARLSTRREQTLTRLQDAREHLERLEDIALELERQLSLLTEEAQQAAKATALSKEKLQLRYSLSFKRVESLTIETKTLKDEDGRLEEALKAGEQEVKDGQAFWHDRREALKLAEAEYRQALADTEAKRGDVRVAQERLNRNEEHKQALIRETKVLEMEIAALKNREAPEKPEGDASGLEIAVQQAQQVLGLKRSNVSELNEERNLLEQRINSLEDQSRAFIQEKATYESRKQQLTEQVASLTERLAKLQDGQHKGIDVLEADLESERVTLESLQQELQEAQAHLVECQKDHANKDAERTALERSMQRSKAALEARQGYAQGPKNALTSGIEGVIGAVVDLIQVPPEYQEALSAALGRRMENVVVDSSDIAKRVLQYTKQQGGYVTLLPLDLISGRSSSIQGELANQAGVIGTCIELIDFEDRYKDVVSQLLGNTTVIENMDVGVNLARRFKVRPRFVSLEGDVVESYGAMTGGRRQQAGSVLASRTEADQAEAAFSAASQIAEEALVELKAAQAKVVELRDTVKIKQESYQELAQSFQKAKEQHAGVKSLVEEVERGLTESQNNLAGLTEPQTPQGLDSVEEDRSKLAELNSVVGAQREEEVLFARQLAEQEQKWAIFKAHKQNYEVALKQYQEGLERLSGLEARYDSLAFEMEKADTGIAEAKTALSEAEAAVPDNLKAFEESFNSAQTATEEAETQLSELTNAQAERKEKRDQVQLTMARRETALEVAQEELVEFPEGIEVIDKGLGTMRQRLNVLEKELNEIGPVNHRAQQEADAQQERYDDLRIQMTEASEAADELEKIIADIDLEVTAKLDHALEHLNIHFERHVKTLFGENSQAGIQVERDEERPVGLSISLQPSGKQTKALNLLSVGERTMGAMAFLFSLINGSGEQKGLPIAILDEVDAPLDEANIRRYCTFLKDLADSGTQFILITHQKATMEVADVLWGVTTEKGVSRMFSIRKEEENRQESIGGVEKVPVGVM